MASAHFEMNQLTKGNSNQEQLLDLYGQKEGTMSLGEKASGIRGKGGGGGRGFSAALILTCGNGYDPEVSVFVLHQTISIKHALSNDAGSSTEVLLYSRQLWRL